MRWRRGKAEIILGGINHCCYYHPNDSPMKEFARVEVIFNPSYYNNNIIQKAPFYSILSVFYYHGAICTEVFLFCDFLTTFVDIENHRCGKNLMLIMSGIGLIRFCSILTNLTRLCREEK